MRRKGEVVILGGGFAGLACAKRLERLWGGQAPVVDARKGARSASSRTWTWLLPERGWRAARRADGSSATTLRVTCERQGAL